MIDEIRKQVDLGWGLSHEKSRHLLRMVDVLADECVRLGIICEAHDEREGMMTAEVISWADAQARE